MTARRLTETIWLVGSGDDPAAFSDPHDCHVFLIDGGSEAALIDCGTGIASDQVLRNAEEVRPLDRIGHILATHYHADHAGGAASLRRSTGAAIHASVPTSAALGTGDEQVTQVAMARSVGIYPPDYHYPACSVDVVLRDNDVMEIGDVRVSAHDTPGHCDGHLSFLADDATHKTLFSGDAIFYGGRVSIQAIPDCRPYAYARTAQRLADLDVDVLLPGHLEFVLEAGREHLRRAAASFARLVPPPNILRSDGD